ncbi:MAG: RrF2 family transcriptional regulator [Flavisolibacter sp.]
MMFSKSFGYAIRGILYIAIMQDEKRFIQSEEIAQNLTVPKHFMSKILKSLVKDGIISSVKGPTGGFTTNSRTLGVPLMKIFRKTEGEETFETCVLRLNHCNPFHPCPLHSQIENIRQKLDFVLVNTTIEDLLKKNQPGLHLKNSTKKVMNNSIEKIFIPDK